MLPCMILAQINPRITINSTNVRLNIYESNNSKVLRKCTLNINIIKNKENNNKILNFSCRSGGLY